MKDFSSSLPLSLSSTLDSIQSKLILVLAYYLLKPIKHGYPNLVIPTLLLAWSCTILSSQLNNKTFTSVTKKNLIAKPSPKKKPPAPCTSNEQQKKYPQDTQKQCSLSVVAKFYNCQIARFRARTAYRQARKPRDLADFWERFYVNWFI